MQSLCEEASRGCLNGCAPFLAMAESSVPKSRTTTTTKASRASFAAVTTASLFPSTHFTNHESLPSLDDAHSSFLEAYPRYKGTELADRIREQEYRHLSDHVCLDYAGFGLFSHDQVHYSPIPSASSSSSPPSSTHLHPPSFNISYKSASIKSQVQHATKENGLESAIRRRVMSFLKVSVEDYHMIYTANRTSAFRLLAESYPFHTNKRLLTVYDHESEAVSGMAESSSKRGVRVMPASFSWPTMRICSSKLRKMVVGKKKKNRGLFVFPLQSRVTGARYSYLWMNLAQENGWHVLLDACALGPKDMDSLGLSLFQPDFLICSFFKVFGENPSGFACLFIKRSSNSVLESTIVARSIGIVSIVPARTSLHPYNSDTESETFRSQVLDDDDTATRSFSGPMHSTGDGQINLINSSSLKQKQKEIEDPRQVETSAGTREGINEENGEQPSSEIVELEGTSNTKIQPGEIKNSSEELVEGLDIECRGLDHADSLGLVLITERLRYMINWLVVALTKLRHPHSENGHPLVRIYGPKVKFDRGPAVAFNVFDWKGEKVEPALVQKLADRSNISLTCSFLHNIWFSDKYEAERAAVLEKKGSETATAAASKRKEKFDLGIAVVTVSLGFLASFEDVYNLWVFVAKFLDADFVEKERWRYMALNQKMVEV